MHMYLQDPRMKGFRDPQFKDRYHSLIHAHVKGMFPTKQYYLLLPLRDICRNGRLTEKKK